MNLETEQIDRQLHEVRAEYLSRMTGGEGELLRQVEEYTAGRGGKMLRPRMLLAAYNTLAPNAPADQPLPRRILLLATVVEMLHNASLLHDDVIDRDLTRRGQPSVNARWGNAVAILVGDYHLVSIMQLISEIGDNDITQKINATVKAMVEAELLQLQMTNLDGANNSSLYLRIIDGKTANLFALAAEFGNPALRDYGLHYGRLFQLRDDVNDEETTPFTADLIAREEKILQEFNL